MKVQQLYKAVAILGLLVLIVVILVYAKPFLVPLTFAALLSMLLLPVMKWHKSKGLGNVSCTLLQHSGQHKLHYIASGRSISFFLPPIVIANLSINLFIPTIAQSNISPVSVKKMIISHSLCLGHS